MGGGREHRCVGVVCAGKRKNDSGHMNQKG